MKLEEVKQALAGLEHLVFMTPDGKEVPAHFHVTEVGKIEKNFIDCGGTVRKEQVVSFQLWSADDTDHRLQPEKLLKIIALSEKQLGIDNQEVEVEYQSETVGKYGLSFDGSRFHLTSKQTTCLAADACGIPAQKPKLKLTDLSADTGATCAPGSGCC